VNVRQNVIQKSVANYSCFRDWQEYNDYFYKVPGIWSANLSWRHESRKSYGRNWVSLCNQGGGSGGIGCRCLIRSSCNHVISLEDCNIRRDPHSSYEGCPESIQPFWLSREPAAWPWYNLAASQRRPYCASVNSHSPVGLVSRQWDAVDWACVLCDRRIHNDRASRSTSSRQCACPFYSSHTGFSGKASHQPGLSGPNSPDLAPCEFWFFPKLKSPLKGRRFECDGHTVLKLSQRRLTADWLIPRESDASRMHSKVYSDWLPSYIKAMRPVLEIFKMAGYFLDSPCSYSK